MSYYKLFVLAAAISVLAIALQVFGFIFYEVGSFQRIVVMELFCIYVVLIGRQITQMTDRK